MIIHESIKNDKEASPFVKVARGVFVLKAKTTHVTDESEGAATATEEEKEETGGIIKAFGMFWRRDWVDW